MVIGGYTIVREIYGGGMARIYVATGPDGRRVVVRQLSENARHDRRMRAGFLRSGDMLSSLIHPNIIEYLGRGTDLGAPYQVLEYVAAPTLRERILRHDPLLPQKAIAIMSQMAHALAYLHGRGLLHMDFKPENLLVTSDGLVKLIDFDLAQPKPRWWTCRLYRGDLSGTPAYIAPETLRHRVIHEQSDIFSYGATCYELLTGHKPFEADSLEQERKAQISPNVTAVPLRRYAPHVPLQVERVVMKCLAKNPRDRYPHVLLIIRDLTGIVC